MNKNFDLNTFLVDSSEITDEDNVMPTWVTKGTGATKVLYSSALEKKNDITEKILSGEKLAVTERKIVNRHLALENKLDPSILNKRRQPELMIFIDEVNEYLSGLWKSKNKKKGTGIKSLSRNELEKEVVFLRKENKGLEKKFCKESIEEALSKVFVSSQLQLSQEIKELRKVLEGKNSTISELRSELREFQIKSVVVK